MPSHAGRDLHLYLDSPEPIFKARVNMPGTITYPVTALIYDGVTLGAFGDLQPDQTLMLGTTEGADDLGRVRVQQFATATQIPLGRVSPGVEDGTLTVTDNAYITVYMDFRVWSKLPVFTADGDVFKDADIAVLSYTTEIPPKANPGPGTVDKIDSTTSLITVAFDGSLSEAIADGATITGYLWDVKDGTITVGTSASAAITATFPAGFRWVGLTVTDSNGKVQTSRCPVLAIDPAADASVQAFAVEGAQRLTFNGQTVAFRLFGDVPRTTVPDGCLVLFWDGWPTGPSDRDHMRLIGWHQSDNVAIRATKTGLIRDTILHCVDVAGRMATLPGFPQALERVTPATTWEHMPNLTMRKALNYLITWHTTAISLADMFLPASLEDWPAMRLDSAGASLWEQLSNRAKSLGPDHILTCNRLGQLNVVADWGLVDVGDRPATSFILTEDLWSELRVDYQRPPRVHVLRASAVVSSTSWLIIGGEETLPLAFSIAPGDGVYGQGVSEATEAEGLTQSQASLNVTTGHRYARLNARYGLWRIVKPDIDVWALEPALLPRVQLNISAETAAQRGLDSTQLVGLVKELSVRYPTTKEGTAMVAELGFERETFGLPAQTVVPELPGPPPEYETPEVPPATVPPEMGLVAGVQQVAGIGIDGYVYRTSDFQTLAGAGGPTWDRVDTTIADTIYSWVVDPFSPGYAPGATSGAINGWIVNDTAIYRVTDLFGTPVAVSVLTFPVATVGASFHWRSIQASFGAYFAEGLNPWLLCVSYYGNTAGHEGTWATYSTDGGVTWAAEVQISAEYDTAVATRFNPIGVWASPRTPGKAYTAAHTGQASLIQWGTWRVGNPLIVLPLAPSASTSVIVTNNTSTLITETKYLLIVPPPNTKRLVVRVDWGANYTRSSGSATGNFSFLDEIVAGEIVNTGTSDFVSPAPNSGSGGSWLETFTFADFATEDWPVNIDSIVSSPPADPGDTNGFRIAVSGNATGGATVTVSLDITVTLTEIEYDDGTIVVPVAAGGGKVSSDWGSTWAATTFITPGDAQAGAIHVPWESNAAEDLAYFGRRDIAGIRQFRLKQSDGGTISDISPNDGTRLYGVNKYGFAIRAFDSNRQYLLLAGIGNDTSASAADDFHAVYISSDYGATWTNIVAPIADTGAPAGRPAFEAAFGGDSQNIIFIWGPEDYIKHSTDFGVTLLDKTGNLAALGASGWVGIAGGVA